MCWKCGKTIDQEYIGREDECPECKTDLHSCLNCDFYEPELHAQCREYDGEMISDKQKRNFCSSFKVKRVFSSVQSQKAKAEDAREAFKNLFGN